MMIMLSQGFELLKFYDDLPHLIKCLQHFSLCEADAQKLLSEHISLKLKLSSVPLSQAGHWLAMIQEPISDMPSTYLRYFQYVHIGAEVTKKIILKNEYAI